MCPKTCLSKNLILRNNSPEVFFEKVVLTVYPRGELPRLLKVVFESYLGNSPQPTPFHPNQNYMTLPPRVLLALHFLLRKQALTFTKHATLLLPKLTPEPEAAITW